MAYIFQGYWEDIGTVRAFFGMALLFADRLSAEQRKTVKPSSVTETWLSNIR
jgi:ADP-glucose pyrophosphorylase